MKKQLLSSESSLNDEGYLEAVFSTFDIIDRDGDVVKSTALKDGTEIPLVWSHDWSKPIGKGTIYNDGQRATFKGNFFLDTVQGSEAYKTVKNMGDLQQYSWGFSVIKQEKGTVDSRTVNIITEAEPFEVSPVLVGANQQTETLAIKSQKMYIESVAPGSYEDIKCKLKRAFLKQQFGDGPVNGYASIVATYSDHFIALLYKWVGYDDEENYWKVSYTVDGDEFSLGDPELVEPQTDFVPVKSHGLTLTHSEHTEFLQVAMAEYVKRNRAGSASRRKDERPISDARKSDLQSFCDSAKQAIEHLEEILSTSIEKPVDGTDLYKQFLLIQAQINGVAV